MSSSFGVIIFYRPFIYYKLKVLGFIHQRINRPIGNARYLFLPDDVIIRHFSYLYIMIGLWFLEASDLKGLSTIFRILKQSCLFTLCRKHNKSSRWVRSVYTTNILVVKNLFNSYNYFPLASEYVLSFRLKNDSFLFIDESFFLID